jgi:hypothetical protein
MARQHVFFFRNSVGFILNLVRMNVRCPFLFQTIAPMMVVNVSSVSEVTLTDVDWNPDVVNNLGVNVVSILPDAERDWEFVDIVFVMPPACTRPLDRL